MKEQKFNICTIDEKIEGQVPLFIMRRDTLDNAIDTAINMIDPLDPNSTEFQITTQCKKTFEQIKLAKVYWDNGVFDVSVVKFPLNIEKMTIY